MLTSEMTRKRVVVVQIGVKKISLRGPNRFKNAKGLKIGARVTV